MAAKLNPESGLWQQEIDGQSYEFEKWGAEESVDTILDISGLVGKPLGMALSVLFGKDEDGTKAGDRKFDPNVIATVMEALTERVGKDKATCKALIKKLGSEGVLCEGKRVTFNTHYQDQLGHLFRVVQAALEVQYGNFFVELLDTLGVKKTGAKAILGVSNRAKAM